MLTCKKVTRSSVPQGLQRVFLQHTRRLTVVRARQQGIKAIQQEIDVIDDAEARRPDNADSTLLRRQCIQLRKSLVQRKPQRIINEKITRLTTIDIENRVFPLVLVYARIIQVITQFRVGRVPEIIHHRKSGTEKGRYKPARHLAHSRGITVT